MDFVIFFVYYTVYVCVVVCRILLRFCPSWELGDPRIGP